LVYTILSIILINNKVLEGSKKTKRTAYTQRDLNRIGKVRQDLVVDMLRKIYESKGYEVHVLQNRTSLLDPRKKMPSGDRFYVYRDGITIVVRPYRKPLDILVYKNGKRFSAWEITNYKVNNYMSYSKFWKYVDNLTLYTDSPNKFLVVTSPMNFRKLFEDRTEKQNIRYAEENSAINHIFLIYWEQKTEPEEVMRVWIE